MGGQDARPMAEPMRGVRLAGAERGQGFGVPGLQGSSEALAERRAERMRAERLVGCGLWCHRCLLDRHRLRRESRERARPVG